MPPSTFTGQIFKKSRHLGVGVSISIHLVHGVQALRTAAVHVQTVRQDVQRALGRAQARQGHAQEGGQVPRDGQQPRLVPAPGNSSRQFF